MISPGTYIRLAQLHNPRSPFFPYLKHLRVIDADSSLSHLNFLLTNSLRSIELVNLTDSNKEVFSSFLITLADECPRLSSITLGQDPGRRLSSSLLSDCLKFSHLWKLELKDVLADVDFELLVTIGQALPALESFILNARTAKYSSKPLPISPTLPQLVPEERATDGSTPDITAPEDRKDDGPFGRAWSWQAATPPWPPMSQSSFAGEPTTSPLADEAASSTSPQAEKADVSSVPPPNFLLLKKLHVTGKLALIEDLLRYIGSTVLEDLALTLVRFTRPQTITRPISNKVKGGKNSSTRGLWKTWTTVVDAESPSFVSVVEEAVHETWKTTLTKLYLGQHEDYVDSPSPDAASSPTLQVSALKVLSHPTLEHLEVSGWKLDSLSTPLSQLSLASSKLKVLHFPVGITNKGIPLSDLRLIAESCPNIVSFQSTITDLQSIPTYSRLNGAEDALSHGLEILSVGNALENSNAQEILDVARHLFILFPNLKEIRTHEGQNEGQWKYIHSLVQMFQIVRLDDAARPRVL